ncbi:PBAN-type neuropeptides-like [Adelges cooleyi]|uniref:PBAN-type neuropeptides-like n=1 Tax=Adelges cooleyi TaxID=133065 RepID=UPI00217FAB9E|nr:PBAN-type neuropeptides-like [Adelges cooleyi]
MFIICNFCVIVFFISLTRANYFNDFQDNQKYGEQAVDYDYPPWSSTGLADLLKSSNFMQYDGGYSESRGLDKRGGATQSSGGIWFGPRLGRRKRRSSYNVMDVNANGPEAGVASASQTVVDLITNAPWVLIPLVENSLYSQQKQESSIRSGRSSSEEAGEEATRHSARSPPYSPPFSPRLGRHADSAARPVQTPRLGRQNASGFLRRDARSVPPKPEASSPPPNQ